MKVVNLYKYKGSNGTVITPVELGIPCTEMIRLISDEGKELVNGTERLSCIDVYPEETHNWDEVPSVETETEEEDD